MCKTCKHTAVSAFDFGALIISPAWKGREADYLMMTFSSIKASVRVEKIFTSEMITRSFYKEIVLIKKCDLLQAQRISDASGRYVDAIG